MSEWLDLLDESTLRDVKDLTLPFDFDVDVPPLAEWERERVYWKPLTPGSRHATSSAWPA